MLRVVSLSLLLVALSATAHAQVFEPDVPRDPPAIRQMSNWLNHDWRRCVLDMYPTDTVGTTAKARTVVHPRRQGPRVAASLTVSFHKLDGTPVPATAAQKQLVQCVKRRFEARRFHPDRRTPKAVVLSNPYTHSAIRQSDGTLNRTLALHYVHRHATRAARACGHKKSAGRLDVVVRLTRRGRLARTTVVGSTPGVHTCIARRLGPLHFPSATKASALTVTP